MTPPAPFSIPGHTGSFDGFYGKSSMLPVLGSPWLFFYLECPQKTHVGPSRSVSFPTRNFLTSPSSKNPHSWATGERRMLGMRHLESSQPPQHRWGFCLAKAWGFSP